MPARCVTAEELDRKLGKPEGYVAQKSGVRTRYFVEHETASQLGARAAEAALANAGLTFADVDCIVGCAGTPEQAIPCTAALIQKQLGHQDSGVPCFDINSTCLSFVTALDLMARLIEVGRYQRVLLVASEVASVGLDWSDPESCLILGDAAAAAVIGPSPEGDPACLLAARMETYSSGSALTQITGGGSGHHPRNFDGDLQGYVQQHGLFQMDGKAVFKQSANLLPPFVARMLAPAGLALTDIDLVVPHQASMAAMYLVQRRLGVPDERWMTTADRVGNTIAASIPLALHLAMQEGRARRGDRLMLLGTSAGFSMGAIALTL
jgi:3-oxoacyl-[acyl-carrier-protein] synthase-3